MASTAALAAICALAVVALLLMRQQERRRRTERRLDVIETSRLGAQGSVAVVRAGERYFLVAATASAVAGVAELDAQEWAPAAARTEAEGAPLVEARTALLGGG